VESVGRREEENKKKERAHIKPYLCTLWRAKVTKKKNNDLRSSFRRPGTGRGEKGEGPAVDEDVISKEEKRNGQCATMLTEGKGRVVVCSKATGGGKEKGEETGQGASSFSRLQRRSERLGTTRRKKENIDTSPSHPVLH